VFISLSGKEPELTPYTDTLKLVVR